LSFRLWGNLLAGSIIITMWYSLTSLINGYIPFIASLNLVGAFTLFPFNAYFDIFAGVIQAYIFCTLTLAYWYLAKGEENIVKQEDNITEINYGFVPSANELTNK
jgi:F-type H+-transporting ATPase subunit a